MTILTREPLTTTVGKVSERDDKGKIMTLDRESAVRTEKHGVEPGEVSGWVAEETGYSLRSAERYLDPKFKAIQQSEAGKLTVAIETTVLSDSVISAAEFIIREAESMVDLESVNGLKKAAKALEREAVLEGVVGDLPEILRLIEGIPCINAENSGVAGGGIRTLQLAIRQLPEYMSKWGLFS